MALNFGNTTNGNLLFDIIEKTNQEKNSIVTMDILIDLIDENPDNEKVFNMDEIEYLAEGIREEGFYGVIDVYKKENGRYEISSGHRRFRAAKMNGEKRIPCIILEEPDEKTKAVRLLSANLRNRKLKPLDMARAIVYYENKVLERGNGRSREKIAKFFNISQTQVHRYKSLLSLIPSLMELANSPEFSYAAFSEAATLSEEDQIQLYEKIVTYQRERPDVNVTTQRIKCMIEEIRRKHNMEDYLENINAKAQGKDIVVHTPPYESKVNIESVNSDDIIRPSADETVNRGKNNSVNAKDIIKLYTGKIKYIMISDSLDQKTIEECFTEIEELYKELKKKIEK
ncbi:MAG: ParB/RepB/Spo0J family partition protein [Lachnospiraceae bacterium]|nr:ParB/RepB/Spo0J family partition protein [Lachnospiraceae bacterium]